MGFYLRKTIKVGGINLNLSSGGLGVSTGVRGFRVGMNGRGTYIQMGRGGLYYRKQVSWRRQSPRSRQNPTYAPPEEGSRFTDQNIVFTENLAQPLAIGLADAGVEQVLAHFRPKPSFGWALGAGAAALFACLWSVVLGVVLFLGVLAAVMFQLLTHIRGALVYDLDDQALRRFEQFVNSFGEFFEAKGFWLYNTRSVTTDWKRNAGATNLMSRRNAELFASGDPAIRTNISIPCLRSGTDAFYFLPDMVVCRQGSTLRSFGYDSVQFSASAENFIEEQGVPTDAQVVRHTWKFVRKDGGPDRRFNNNRQLPVCRYQTIALQLGGEFSRVFSKSRLAEPKALTQGFTRMAEVLTHLRVVDDLAALPAPVAPGATS